MFANLPKLNKTQTNDSAPPKRNNLLSRATNRSKKSSKSKSMV